MSRISAEAAEQQITIAVSGARLEGNLTVPPTACGMVVFVHGSGSSRFSPRNQAVASALNDAGLATLLFDLLTTREAMVDERTAEFRFDIGLLARRTSGTIQWLAEAWAEEQRARHLPIGLFGASTGAAAALIAAAENPGIVRAVVSRGGRPDLAGEAIPRVKAPTLLIVGGRDQQVIVLNRDAQQAFRGECRMEIVPGATHLFEEPGALEQVTRLAADWFLRHLPDQPSGAQG